MELDRSSSNTSPVATSSISEERQRSSALRRSGKTPPPLKLPSLALLSNSKMIDKNHDLASQVVVGPMTPTGGEGSTSNAKHKHRRRSKSSTVRDHEDHVRPICREIGIQVEILPVPKKSPGRFLSFGKRTDSSNGIRRVSLEIELTDSNGKAMKMIDNNSKGSTAETPHEELQIMEVCTKSETALESKKNRVPGPKKSLKTREKNLFNKVRKMSQFISALKNSSANKRRKAEEALAAAVHQTNEFGHNGQCCQVHGCTNDLSKPQPESSFGNVTFEDRPFKDNLGLPSINDKLSKVYYFDQEFSRGY